MTRRAFLLAVATVPLAVRARPRRSALDTRFRLTATQQRFYNQSGVIRVTYPFWRNRG